MYIGLCRQGLKLSCFCPAARMMLTVTSAIIKNFSCFSDEVQIGPETVMTTLYTAKKYAVPALEKHCVDFLKRNLSPDNAFMLLTQVQFIEILVWLYYNNVCIEQDFLKGLESYSLKIILFWSQIFLSLKLDFF